MGLGVDCFVCQATEPHQCQSMLWLDCMFTVPFKIDRDYIDYIICTRLPTAFIQLKYGVGKLVFLHLIDGN